MKIKCPICNEVIELDDEKIFVLRGALPPQGHLFKAKPSLKQENKPEQRQESRSWQFLDISQFKSLTRLTTYFDGVCEKCGFKGKMDFQITMLDDTWGLLCESCGRELEKQLGKVD